MINIFRGLFGCILCTAIFCNAAPPPHNLVRTAPQGVTNVAAVFGKDQVSVRIATHEVDIGKPGDTLPLKRPTNCTYSRFPCSLVDYIEVDVNGKALFVDRSVFVDLADIGMASLRKERRQFMLTLDGGDASESYTVEITFDKDLIRQRELKSNLNGQIMQRTTYFNSQSMDE